MSGDVVLRLATGSIDLDGSLRVLAMLPGDPTLRCAPGLLARATRTPDGPASISVRWDAGGGEAVVVTAGPGAGWLAERSPGLLGVTDDPAGFDPRGLPARPGSIPPLGLRVPRTATVWHDLCWLVVQQRITRVEAAQQWRRLVERFGEPAPGGLGLRLPPSRERLAGLASHELNALGIERRRGDTLRAAARSTIDIEALADGSVEEATRRLTTIPGIGPWTTSTLAAVTWGDPDTVIVGDSGIPALVAWFLARERTADDARMLELLEPYRPHRYRVIQHAFVSGQRPPRRGPRRW